MRSTASSLEVRNGSKRSRCKTEESYLGVRVRMPVRDLLRNIRIAKGMDPKDIQRMSGKASKGDKKRVKSSADRRNSQKKRNSVAQEELSIIVEVLEEDLKKSTSTHQPNKLLASANRPEHNPLPEEFFPQTYFCELSQKTEMVPSPEPPSPPAPSSPDSFFSFPCAEYRKSYSVLADSFSDYSSDDSEDFRASPQQYVPDSPSSGDYQFPSYHDSCQSSPESACDFGLDYAEGSATSQGLHNFSQQGSYQQKEWSNDFFFWNQLEREGNLLKRFSNRELLVPDRNGKLLLHRLVEEGKRAPVYIIAKRMADLMQLNAKDQEGKTALHMAAEKNQHVMVADLISLGANINERDQGGKTCLHLSAENGYVRVLEVIKYAMRDGVHVDLEVKDMNGLSILQSAVVALSGTVQEGSVGRLPQDQARLSALRKEQMMETLECLLQMESNVHNVEICMT
ncbi:NF-kappa-B inhibitor zeta isoform X2 [Sardina pilchardus]|uniref:NF-kappa-B inhibitor zeta isoform X2 n=1 Tax=Sardina pilchardus TaxID=27697 RepID=UPI002E166251